MKKIAIILVAFSLILSGCSQLYGVIAPKTALCPINQGVYMTALQACVNAGYEKYTIVIKNEADRQGAEDYIQGARHMFPNASINTQIVVSCDDEIKSGSIIDGRVVIVYQYKAGCPGKPFPTAPPDRENA